jgi:DNA-binding FadR family transcriptional regulator
MTGIGQEWTIGHTDLDEGRAMSNKRLYHEVADKIKSLINEGSFPPGSRLPGERELAERFDVSRVTVREAEIVLQALGYISIKTGSGVYVLDPTNKNGEGLPDVSAFELTEARLMFESEAASLAALHISDEQLEHLSELVKQIADDKPNTEEISQLADRNFHLAIAEASGNAAVRYIVEILWKIRDELPAVKNAYEWICQHEDATDRKAEHTAVLDALRKRDPLLARRAMQDHFRGLLEAMIDVTEQRAVEELRKSATESRQRFLANEKRRRHA